MGKLESNPNNCLIALSQTDDLFESIIRYTNKSLCALINAYPIFLLDGFTRTKIMDILELHKVYFHII